MFNDDIPVINVPQVAGIRAAVWIPAERTMVVSAESDDDQVAAVMRLVDRLLELSAARDRRPAVSSD